MTLREWHHGYVGLAALAGSFVYVLAVDRPHWIAALVWLAGLWLLADDAYQHWRQHYEPDYRSPVNRLWGWMLRYFH